MSRCIHGVESRTDECRACEDIGERRVSGDEHQPSEREYDALEAGAWWHYAPGMAPREGW